jgi:hypothetical protein
MIISRHINYWCRCRTSTTIARTIIRSRYVRWGSGGRESKISLALSTILLNTSPPNRQAVSLKFGLICRSSARESWY